MRTLYVLMATAIACLALGVAAKIYTIAAKHDQRSGGPNTGQPQRAVRLQDGPRVDAEMDILDSRDLP